LRRSDGSLDRHSSGTWVGADGKTVAIASHEFDLRPGKTWHSPASGATYPVSWQIDVPKQGLRLSVSTRVADQELRSDRTTGVTYWEGAIDVEGTQTGQKVRGRGYLEMTGYAGQAIGEKFR
jgi:predicted secreted hydrolase